MTHHLVDGNAHAFGESLIVQTGRNRLVFLAIGHTNIIYFLGRHTHTDMTGHLIETTCIHDTAFANTLYLFGRFDEVTCRHFLALSLPKHNLLVHLCRILPRKTMPTSLFLKHALWFKTCAKLLQNQQTRKNLRCFMVHSNKFSLFLRASSSVSSCSCSCW